jgi:hypothetical protein
MYKLQVVNFNSDPVSIIQAWYNFNKYLNLGYGNQDDPTLFDVELAKFNCKNVINTDYVVFETKEDAVDFLLRWS